MAATARILDFLRDRRPEGPCLVVDLEVIADNYKAFARAMPATRIFYAVKANPAPEILSLLAGLGSCFDTAGRCRRSRWRLLAGATADRISFGNTVKKERDIARAHALGVTLFAVDSVEEVEKIARAAPGAKVFCRILTDGEGAEWPLSRKFGCVAEMAIDVLDLANRGWGSTPTACRFMSVRSRCSFRPGRRALLTARRGFSAHSPWQGRHALHGQSRRRVSGPLSQGRAEGVARYSDAIRRRAWRSILAMPSPRPRSLSKGRGMVGNAGVIKAEVVLVSKKQADDDKRWVFLDIGKFGGLAETMEEAKNGLSDLDAAQFGDPKAPCIIAGPTCDSADVLYEKTPYDLPITLTVGDEVLIEAAGA